MNQATIYALVFIPSDREEMVVVTSSIERNKTFCIANNGLELAIVGQDLLDVLTI